MLLVLFAFLFTQFSSAYFNEPPKTIDRLEGYKSKRARSSQKNWDHAQQLLAIHLQKTATLFWRSGLPILVFELILLFTQSIFVFQLMLLIETITFLLSLFLIYYSIESKLDKS